MKGILLEECIGIVVRLAPDSAQTPMTIASKPTLCIHSPFYWISFSHISAFCSLLYMQVAIQVRYNDGIPFLYGLHFWLFGSFLVIWLSPNCLGWYFSFELQYGLSKVNDQKLLSEKQQCTPRQRVNLILFVALITVCVCARMYTGTHAVFYSCLKELNAHNRLFHKHCLSRA